MKKRSGPALTLQKLSLTRCPYCNGSGTVKPMFHEMLCASCNGLGGMHKETGEGLPADDVIMQLRIRLREYAQKDRRQRQRISELEAGESGRGYGAGG